MASKLALTAAAVVVVAAGGAATLAVRPPELLKVGANYGAKIVCSNVFIAGRDAQAVLADDVQAPGHPVLKHLDVKVDSERKTVRAHSSSALSATAWRSTAPAPAAPGADGDVAQAAQHQFKPIPIWAPSPNVAWPTGSRAEVNPAVQACWNRTRWPVRACAAWR
jgi:hypothetical protein